MFDEHCYYCRRYAIYAVYCHDPKILAGDRGPVWVETCGHCQGKPQAQVSTIKIPGRCACHGSGKHTPGTYRHMEMITISMADLIRVLERETSVLDPEDAVSLANVIKKEAIKNKEDRS